MTSLEELCPPFADEEYLPLIKERILPNVALNDNGCWEWQNYCFKTGYGSIRIKNKTQYTHRVVYNAFFGDIPKGMVIRHRCNNRRCCNPNHLQLGTYGDNQNDSYASGNRPKKLNYQRKRKPNGLCGEELVDWLKINVVESISENGCWLTREEYPKICIKSKEVVSIHRYIHCIRYGMNYKDKRVVRHLCNNKRCINPDHLTSGTQRDNALDSRADYGHVKITAEQAIELATDYRDTTFDKFGLLEIFCKKWAKTLSLNKCSVYQIVSGKNWSDVTQVILDQKIVIWRPRIPFTKLNPEIVAEVKQDMRNWDFSQKGQKASFDRHWASKLNLSIRHIANIRTGHKWSTVQPD